MDAKQISIVELNNEINEVYNMLVDLLELPKQINSVVTQPLIPALAFISAESDIFLGKNFYEEVYGENSYKILKETRMLNKLNYDKRIGVTKRALEKLLERAYEDLVSDYNIIQKGFIKMFGQDNYSIAYYKGKPYYNYLQLYEFLVSVIDDSKQSKTIKSDIKNFSADLSTYIKNVKFVLEDVEILNEHSNVETLENQNINKTDFKTEDYKLYKDKHIFNKKYPLEISAYMFNLLCSINFVLYVLPQLISENSSFYNRYLIIIYISVSNVLSKLKNQKEFQSTSWFNEFSVFYDNKEKIIKGNSRSNIFHYNLIFESENNPE